VRDQQRDCNTIADGLGLRPPRTLLVKWPSSQIEISRIACGPETVGMTSVIPATETFALGVYQTDIPYHKIWRRGHPVIRQGYAAQSTQLADLADEYAARICATHEVVAFSILYTVLDDVADDSHQRRVRGLGCDPGSDGVVTHLMASLLPALEQPHLASALSYGALAPIRVRGGLDALRLKRGKDLIAVNLGDDLSLARPMRPVARAFQPGLQDQHRPHAASMAPALSHRCGQTITDGLVPPDRRHCARLRVRRPEPSDAGIRPHRRYQPAQWRRDRPLQ
jgi:hypothetical protein